MQFIHLQGETSVAALVQRAWGIAPGAAGAAAAEAALRAANPHLDTIGKLPQGTPIVLPQAAPAPAAAAGAEDPRRAALLGTLAAIAKAVPLRTVESAEPDAEQRQATATLQADIAAFAKQFGG